MTKEDIISKMVAAGVSLTEEREIQYGINLYFDNSSNVRYYTKSKKLVVEGKGKELTEAILKTSSDIKSNKGVFIVYGHDETARDELELMLLRWGLSPIILCQKPSGGLTIIEALEKHMKDVKYGVVLATPDDIGYAKENEKKKKYRARQNVVFEMGMLYAKIDRQNVAVLIQNSTELDLDMENPSDLDGIIYIDYKNSVTECKERLAKELRSRGYILED